ncbi:hypothetical protein GCM10022254_65500 [Actinomadura meridiana]|uniref:Integral membrane protein n=1 Tax=Actinomadura meridiana TaxID=559626 RepID=A0ABP8CKW0_9ACTN
MSKRPVTVQAAAVLEAVEGVAAIGFGAYTGVETATGEAFDAASAIGVTVLALAGGLGMLACARGLRRADQWSRAPTVLTQLFALPIAWSLWQSDRPAIALPMAVVAVLALISVLSSPTTAWLLEDDEDTEHDDDTEHGEDIPEAAAAPAQPEAPQTPAEPRSLGQRLKDRLKEQPTKD